MKFAKIQFGAPEAYAQAIHGLMQRGKIVVLRDRVLIVPAPAIDWLNRQGIPHQFLHWLNRNDVRQTRPGEYA